MRATATRSERDLRRRRSLAFVCLTVASPVALLAGLIISMAGQQLLGTVLALGLGGLVATRVWARIGVNRPDFDVADGAVVPLPAPVAPAPTPVDAALEVQATHRYEAAQRKVNRSLWVVGLACFCGFVAMASTAEGHSSDLVKHGGQASGTVVGFDQPSGLINHDDVMEVSYLVGNVAYDGRVQLDDASPTYAVGEPITVYYDRADPSDMTIAGQDNQPAWSVAVTALLLAVGLLFLVSGVIGARRARKRRSVLGTVAWQETTLMSIDGNRLDLASQSLRASASRRWLANTYVPGAVWVANGTDDRHVVVAKVGGAQCVFARRL